MRRRGISIVSARRERIQIFVAPQWAESWKPYNAEGTLISDRKTGRPLRLYVNPRVPQPEKEAE